MEEHFKKLYESTDKFLKESYAENRILSYELKSKKVELDRRQNLIDKLNRQIEHMGMEIKKFRLDDSLQKIIDWDTIMGLDRYAGGHDDQMKCLFEDAKVIGHWNQGGYQGIVATCVQLPDERFAIYNDYYGTCSGCDSWVDASDEEVRNMCINLANGAYVFKNLEDVKDFLSDEEKDVKRWNSWETSTKKGLLDAINKID